MKSVSVLTFNSEEQKLKESYRDYASNWMTAVEAIDENLFIGSDNSFNLFALKKHVDEEEVHQLVEFAQFHNGELINRFRHGSLTLPSMDGNRPAEPVLVYGTVSGSVGVIAKVDEKYQVVLQKMEEVMGTRIESVGKLSHDRYATFVVSV